MEEVPGTSKPRRRLREQRVRPIVKRRKELECEVADFFDAVGKGLLSPTLDKRLQGAETELAAPPASLSAVIRVDDALKRLAEAMARCVVGETAG